MAVIYGASVIEVETIYKIEFRGTKSGANNDIPVRKSESFAHHSSTKQRYIHGGPLTCVCIALYEAVPIYRGPQKACSRFEDHYHVWAIQDPVG